MRSSKKRSRSGPNRPRPVGNIVNRVFDSSGPEGKVRGTPQQIIEKYQTLARDAQLANDRVAAENFLQHAEHYTRLLAEAQRELAAEQEARQQQQQQQPHSGNGGGYQGGRERDTRERDAPQHERQADRQGERAGELPAEPSAAAELIDLGRDEGGLVDLPEGRGAGTSSRRRSRSDEREQPAQHAGRDAPASAPASAPAPERVRRAAAPVAAPVTAEAAGGEPAPDSDVAVAEGAAEPAEGGPKAPARRPRRPRTTATKPAASKPAAKADLGESVPDAGASA